jgi:hypothetical protein
MTAVSNEANLDFIYSSLLSAYSMMEDSYERLSSFRVANQWLMNRTGTKLSCMCWEMWFASDTENFITEIQQETIKLIIIAKHATEYVIRIKCLDRLCGLVVRVLGYIMVMHCVSCEVRTEFICYVEESRPPLWSSGQSSWLHNGDVLYFLWGTNWIYICYVEESRPPLWSEFLAK